MIASQWFCSDSKLQASNGPTAISATQPCMPIGCIPVRPRIVTVPTASENADSSISISANGASSTIGSKPSTSTPAKLTLTPVQVRQPIFSRRNSTASTVVIGM